MQLRQDGHAILQQKGVQRGPLSGEQLQILDIIVAAVYISRSIKGADMHGDLGYPHVHRHPGRSPNGLTSVRADLAPLSLIWAGAGMSVTAGPSWAQRYWMGSKISATHPVPTSVRKFLILSSVVGFCSFVGLCYRCNHLDLVCAVGRRQYTKCCIKRLCKRRTWLRWRYRGAGGELPTLG